MSLRLRTLLILIAVLILLESALYWTFANTLSQNASAFESQSADAALARLDNALDNEYLQLDTSLHDWSSWDDTYQFAAGNNPDYVDENFSAATFQNLHLQLMVTLDQSGQLLYGMLYDPAANGLIKLPPSLAALDKTELFTGTLADEKPRQGLIETEDGVMLLVARPVFGSNGEGPANGVLIFGRLLNQETGDRMMRLVDLPMSFFVWNDPQAQSLLKAYPVLAAESQAEIAEPMDENRLLGLRRLDDISANPVMLVLLDIPRTAQQSARSTLQFGLIALLLIGLVMIVLVFVVMERGVLDPLASLSSQVRRIGVHGDISQRIHISAHKELNETAQSINATLDALEESQRVLAAEQQRYQAIVEDQTEWIIRFLPDGNLTFANAAFCNAFHFLNRGWKGMNWFTLLPESAVRELQEVCAHLVDTKVAALTLQISADRDKVVRHSWVLRAITDDKNVLTEIQGVGEDVTEQLYMQEKLHYLGTHDALTGLNNRAYFELQLERLQTEAFFPVALVIADLDGLKLANDQYGHVAGDALLCEAARLLRESFRSQDLVARIGGDEFAALLLNTDANMAVQIVRRVRTNLVAHNATSSPVMGLSIGWAIANQHTELKTALHQADELMYHEKFSRRPVAQLENALGVRANAEILSLLSGQDTTGPVADKVLALSRVARMEQALEESETRYRALLELLPVITYVAQLDEPNAMLFVSQQIETWLGYSASEWLAQPMWLDRVHPQDRERVMELLYKARETGESFLAEYRMLTASNRVVWVQDRARVIRVDQTVLLHGVLIDLTQRKETEALLARQNQELVTLFDLTATMNRSESLETIFDAALGALRDMLEVDHAAILLYDDRDVMRFRAWSGLSEEYRSYAEGHSPWSRDSVNPVPVLVADVMLESSLEFLRPNILREGIRALGFVPLVYKGNLLGKFMLYYDTVHVFTPDQIQLAQIIANQTAIAIVRTQAQEALQTAHSEMEALFNGVPDLYFRVDAQGTFLAYQVGMLQDMYLEPETFIGRRAADVLPEPMRAPLLEALAQCRSTGQPVTVEYQLAQARGMQTFEARLLALPRDEYVIIVRNITARRASEDLNRGLTRLAGQLQEAQTRRAATQLVADLADDLLGWDAFHLVLYSHARAELYETVLAYDLIEGVRQELPAVPGIPFTPLIERAVHEKDLLILRTDPEAEASADFRFGSNRAAASLLLVQVQYHAEVLGVLTLESYTANAYDADSLKTLRAIADQLGIVFARLQAQEDLRNKNVELASAYDETIEGWARALELRDTITHGHAQRVVEMTIVMARRLGIPENEIMHIRRGALLHDIGKVGIPDEILFKRGDLTAEEWSVMRRHPAYAYEMLKDIAYLYPAIDIPYAHHEWWNGAGYPRGLKGDEIPLSARIFAVVDVWDALSSDRTYRDHWSQEQVRAYLKQQAGLQFDPHVVQVFMELLDEQCPI